MEYWNAEDKNGITFSDVYRELENDPDFKTHPRFKGDFKKITVEDIEYYKEKGTLPDEIERRSV